MEYQEIITEYKNGSIDVSELKSKMEIAGSLQKRPAKRAADMFQNRISISFGNQNMLIIPETPEKIKRFEIECKWSLKEYYKVLIESIKSTKAWKIMGLVPSEYSLEKFNTLDRKKQFEMIFFLSEKYQKFMEYQKIADISNYVKGDSYIDDEILKKILFLKNMFEALNNEEVRNDFYAFAESPELLKALISFKKARNKTQKLPDFISKKSKVVREDYELFSKFFTTENFRDIAECLILSSKTLNVPVTYVIDAFCELSEGELEQRFLQDEYDDFKKLEEKYVRIDKIKKDIIRKTAEKRIEESKATINHIDNPKVNNKSQQLSGRHSSAINIEAKENKKVIEVPSEVSINAPKKQVSTNKEKVRPIIFTWLGTEDISLGRRVGVKNINAYLENVHKEEKRTGVRASLFLITNSNKEITLKRMAEIKKRAKEKGMPNFVEGAFGGYNSFFIDAQGNITDIATMSDENRKKLIKLLDSSFIYSSLLSNQIDENEKDFIRYVFSNKKDKSITINSLKLIKKHILANTNVKIQPIELIPFIEGRFSGIDVLLKHQLLGKNKIPNYYKSKYDVMVLKGESITLTIDELEGYTLEER